MPYNEALDPDQQITTEELIAAAIFDRTETTEEEAQKLGRDILLVVLAEFRPDLVTPDEI